MFKGRTGGKERKGKGGGNESSLLGWKARGCEANVKDGVLTLRGGSQTPFLGFAAGGQHGPAVVRLRARLAENGGG
jgi:hypothetical protein